MKIWLKSCVVFLCILLLTLVLDDLNVKYNPFKLISEFHYYKWVIPCFCISCYLTFQIPSMSRALVLSLTSVLLFYLLELTYQYNFSGISMDTVYPLTLWELKKEKLMIFLRYELKPLAWFMSGFLGFLFSVLYKLLRNRKLQGRKIYG